MKDIKLIKNRSDIGAGTRGSDMGIDAIEIAAINAENSYFNQFDFMDVETENESIYNKGVNSFAKRIKHVLNQCTRLSGAVQETLENNQFPLVISGDHSSALGTISGIKAANPDKRVGVVWIDAHADIHSPYTSPSGNIHGMPLAAALADDNLDCQINNIDTETASLWEAMKNIGVDKVKVEASDVVYFGVRDTEEPEDKQIEKLGIKNYKVAEVRYRGMDTCVNEAIDSLSNCDLIYVSFDVDSMDCDMISYGTGTPVPKGFDQYEIIEIINKFIVTKKVASIEFVEVNPLLDLKGNKMAETAFEILDAITKEIKANK
ncbi:arginase [Pontimicrobium sp. IMCC45349]|uniref:arginase n=1 Tax=Pontimicrobium sp. IMCC45349 TaxID=3391574 RepID=UPI0039A1F2E8